MTDIRCATPISLYVLLKAQPREPPYVLLQSQHVNQMIGVNGNYKHSGGIAFNLERDERAKTQKA